MFYAASCNVKRTKAEKNLLLTMDGPETKKLFCLPGKNAS